MTGREARKEKAAVGKKHPLDRREDFSRQAMPFVNVMFAVALRMTQDEKDAEDLVQEAMLRAYRFFDKFKPGTNLKAWLIKVMTNIFLNKVKRASKRPPMVEFETVEELLGEVKNDWADISSASEGFRECLDDEVANALDDLPVDYRVPVLLSAIDGLSYREMAEVIGCPLGTVMSRLYRGRKMLEHRLFSYAKRKGFLKRRGAK